MYAISNNYKTYINSSLSRTPKSKVVIEGVEYLDNVLMSTPKISHNNETMIGGFPSKTCSFEIKDDTGTLILNNKWITVYRGLLIDGSTEWIPMGIFKNLNDEDITTNKTTKTISFKGYDKRQLLDVAYSSTLDWNNAHTGLEIIQEACSNGGLTLESTSFNFASYSFTKKPNFPSDITNTEVISRMAEIGGGIALITRGGKVHIKTPTATNVSISKTKRKALTKEKQFGAITRLVLGNEGYDDDVIYGNEGIEWRIENNPFVELIRDTIIQTIAPFIIGKSITPFELNECMDDFYLDLNDTITIVNSDGSTFTSTILSYETANRTKSNIKAPTQNTTLSNYEIAGGIKNSLNAVRFEVDYVNNQIKGLVTTTDDLTKKTSEVIQNAEEHTTTFYDEVIKPQVDDLTKALNQEIEKRSAAVREYMDDDGNMVVELGASSSIYTLKVQQDGLYIYQSGELLQYLQGSFAKIPNLEVEDTFKFGSLILRKNSNGKIRGVRAGDN